MRRWLTFVLALQFLCSVSALAYGPGKSSVSVTETASIVISVMDEASKAVQGAHLTVLDSEHDLLDDKPELPEWLGLTWNRLSLAAPWDTPLTLEYPDWAPPTLAGLQRPPQA